MAERLDLRALTVIGAFAQAAVDAMAKAASGRTQLSMSAAAALNLVDSFPEISVSGLANALNMSLAGTVRVVDELQRQDLVSRKVDERDRRSVALAVTPAGHARAVGMAEARLEALSAFLSQLDAAEANLLGDMADRMLRQTIISDRVATHVCRFCLLDNCPPERCPLEHAAEP